MRLTLNLIHVKLKHAKLIHVKVIHEKRVQRNGDSEKYTYRYRVRESTPRAALKED